MSESLAPDPKPSCCLSSPQGTCEQHATFSEDELRILELEAAIREAVDLIRAGDPGLADDTLLGVVGVPF